MYIYVLIKHLKIHNINHKSLFIFPHLHHIYFHETKKEIFRKIYKIIFVFNVSLELSRSRENIFVTNNSEHFPTKEINFLQRIYFQIHLIIYFLVEASNLIKLFFLKMK